MRTTIKMVAEDAGVSRGTVDRVLNNRGKVRPEIEKKVLESMDKLNYRPNTAARALAFNKKVRKIGFLIPNRMGFFKNEILRGIEKGKEESEYLGIQIIVKECDANNPNEYIRAIDELLEEEVFGFAISASNATLLVEKINSIIEQGIPVITVNSDIGNCKRSMFVGQNSIAAGRIAAELIYKYNMNNNEDILVVAGIPEFESHVERISGFIGYMNEKGISNEKIEVIYTYENYDLTYSKVLDKIQSEKGYRMIYVATNSIIACTDAIVKAGKAEDTFIVTHDTDQSTIELLKKGIVDFTIEQDMYYQGWKPIQILREYLLRNISLVSSYEETYIKIISSESIVQNKND